MKKLLILTDSLGLPRENPETVKFEQTWPYFLRKDFEIIQSSIGGASVLEIYNQTCFLRWSEPDITILQVGVVDCAPRALTQFENDLFNHFWFSRNILKRTLPIFSKFLRKYRNISYQSPKNFIKYLDDIKRLLPNSKIFALSILPATDDWENKVPGIRKKVDEYNLMLYEKFNNYYIDLSGIDPNGIMSDHHHLNAVGHEYVYKQVMKRLNDFLS